MKHSRYLALIFFLLQLPSNSALSQQETASWKQDVPLPNNQRITLWLDQGWLKAARLNEKNEPLWAVVLMRWSPNEKLRVEHQGAGINVYGPKDELILRNSLYDSFFPMVLRCNHTAAMPDTSVLIDPATFGMHGFAPRGFTDEGLSMTQYESNGWIYIATGPRSSKRVQSLVRLMPKKLYKENMSVMVGTDGMNAKAGEYQVYDENGFLFVQQMSDTFAKHETDALSPLLDKKAPPLAIQYWLNTSSPVELDSLRGSVVLIYFWAIWGQPSVAHLGDLESLAREHHSDPFRILTIHTSSSSNRLEEFLKGRESSLPIGVDSGKTFELYARNTVSTYVLIDKKGFVRSVSTDPPSEALILQLLRQ